jgi:sulfite reductase (ferredoxin)
MGMTHGKAETFPYLARPICSIGPGDVLETAEAVVKLFRDHGNRSDRKRARIKYLIHDWGVERFREALSKYLGRPLLPPRGVAVTGVDLHLGWHPQGDGHWFYGLNIENGRVKDDGDSRLRTGLRTIAEKLRPRMHITPQQDVLLSGLKTGIRGEVEAILDAHGIPRPEKRSPLRQLSMACPAVPTCGLALTEAERLLPDVITQLDQELVTLGLAGERISVRMTGCPNGCARPYQSEIGLVGRSGTKYVIYVGGSPLGDRLNMELKDLVPVDAIVPTLRPVLTSFKNERHPREGFGDYCHRVGVSRLKELVTE